MIRTETAPENIAEFASDESGIVQACDVEAVCFPESEQEVSELLTKANETGTLVTTSGAGTGLNGGRVAIHGGQVLATQGLRAPQPRELPSIQTEQFGKQYVIHIDEERQEAYVPAGVSTELLEQMLPEELLYPPDPTEKSGFIGANIACNASGSRTFYYGASRHWVLGLRVVLPTGDIIDISRGDCTADDELRFASQSGTEYVVPLPSYQMPAGKNAAGLYAQPGMDLVDLFVGSEGILGVITEVHLKLTERPDNIVGEIAFFASEAEALGFIDDLRTAAAGAMTVLSIEYFDINSLDFMEHEVLEGKDYGAAVYTEVVGTLDELDPLIAALDANNYVADWFADSSEEALEQKQFRHSLPDEVNSYLRRHDSQAWITDFAVPAEKFPEMLQAYHAAGAALREKFPREGKHYLVLGHIGNYHLHIPFIAHTEDELRLAKQLYADLARQAIAWGGTVSAEHGVGKKTFTTEGRTIPYLELMYGKQGVLEIARAKQALDPNLILNVGNMVPRSYLEELNG